MSIQKSRWIGRLGATLVGAIWALAGRQWHPALQPLDAEGDDSLIDDLLAGNPAFQALVAKSKAGARKAFVRAGGQ